MRPAGAKKGIEPLHLQMNINNGEVLMPGELRTVVFDCNKASLPKHFNISAEGYNVERQTIKKF
jgi:hypothetical protein